MDIQKINRWICLHPNCNLGRAVDTVPELLSHSQQQHKLIKFDKFREMIISFVDDCSLSRLSNEQHYLTIINRILQYFLRKLLNSKFCTHNNSRKFDEFYEQIHPRQMFVEVTQAIMQQNEIDKEILNIYLDNYIKKFEISQQTQQKLYTLQSQIQNFCQSQQIDLLSQFVKQLQLREPANVIKQSQEIINPVKQIEQNIAQFDIKQSSKELVFTKNLRVATTQDYKCYAYFKGVDEVRNKIMQIKLKVLKDDDFIFNIGVVSVNHDLNDYEGCFLLTQTGTFLLERESSQSKLKVNDGSIIKVRYAKKHPKKVFFQVDNNLNDKIKLNQELIHFQFIVILKNAEVELV
ncbi:unnamed protein product (macronuclear) [Paramecium tetraurelia]|uniref:Uncharacterized protein n=1 Tax=Paramecium tetraurelia TaxID=5888 RepID=A0DDR7_PARTE|nr:uncharacterized protein GSPATT00016025001 [Paramecium tetraurelia]CAK81184.1 unnamed protein product [Paramecium tetraurelia]|eukprot:XP_001448581.1 hypothetical protein (macronuclear) [Paramecium tetraurelia strain d4-2]